MLLPDSNQLHRTGSSTVTFLPRIRSDQMTAVNALQSSRDERHPLKLSKTTTVAPSMKMLVNCFRHSASFSGGEKSEPARPVLMIEITSASRPLPVPAAGASIKARGVEPEIAG